MELVESLLHLLVHYEGYPHGSGFAAEEKALRHLYVTYREQYGPPVGYFGAEAVEFHLMWLGERTGLRERFRLGASRHQAAQPSRAQEQDAAQRVRGIACG
jgi:hypothetical protein